MRNRPAANRARRRASGRRLGQLHPSTAVPAGINPGRVGRTLGDLLHRHDPGIRLGILGCLVRSPGEDRHLEAVRHGGLHFVHAQVRLHRDSQDRIQIRFHKLSIVGNECRTCDAITHSWRTVFPRKQSRWNPGISCIVNCRPVAWFKPSCFSAGPPSKRPATSAIRDPTALVRVLSGPQAGFHWVMTFRLPKTRLQTGRRLRGWHGPARERPQKREMCPDILRHLSSFHTVGPDEPRTLTLTAALRLVGSL